MASTDAQRSRRYRRHKAGDHSLCTPGRCAAVTDRPVTVPVTPIRDTAPPEPSLGFSHAGQAYWDAVTALGPVRVTWAPLLVQACRIIDRLDSLDRQLHGEDWLRFRHDESGLEVTVFVDKVLAEEREQAVALKGIVAELDRAMGKVSTPEKKGGGIVASIAAARAARGPLPAS